MSESSQFSGKKTLQPGRCQPFDLASSSSLAWIPLVELSPLLNDASDALCSEVLQDLLPLVAGRLAALDQEIAEEELPMRRSP